MRPPATSRLGAGPSSGAVGVSGGPRGVGAQLLALVLAMLLVTVTAASAQDGAEEPGQTIEPGGLVGEAQLPGLGIRLVDVPRELAADPRAQLSIIDHVSPGAELIRHVDVSNGTDRDLPVDVYPVAASVDEGWVVEEGRTANELASWTSVTPPSLTLGPGEVRRFRVRIKVPLEAGGGEQYMAIVADAQLAEQQGSAVTVRSRIGVRAYLSVSGGPAPVSDFTITQLTARRDPDGTPQVVVQAINTGDRALDLSGSLLLQDGPGQLTAGPFPVAAPSTVGPGGTTTVLVPLDRGIPDGPWTAVATLRSGLLERQAQAEIVFPTEAGAVAEPVAAGPIDKPLLLSLASLLWVIAVLALVVFVLARRRDVVPVRPAADARKVTDDERSDTQRGDKVTVSHGE